MLIARPSYFLKWIFPSAIWRVKTKAQDIYLTFDDGPVPEVTPWVLDYLKDEQIKATFFCVGDNVRKYPELYDRILNEGHTVGNHTYNHLSLANCSKQQYKDNVLKAEKFINSALFRPPHGRLNLSINKWLSTKYTTVMWDILTGDYDKERSGGDCFRTVKRLVRKGSVIVFHDSIKADKNLREALPKTVEYLKSNNWEFKTIQI